MNTRKAPGFLLVALLAFALIAAPLLSAFAAPKGGAVAVAESESMAHHHDGAPVSDSSSCTKHTDCQAQCCSACAHCVTVAFGGPLTAVTVLKSVLMPVVPATSLASPPTGLIRPPQIDRR
jgi:hypothetical protein